MSHLANFRFAKADSPVGIRMLKSTVKPIDDPSSADKAGAFPRSPVGGRSLEATIHSDVEGTWDNVNPVEGAQVTIGIAVAGPGSDARIFWDSIDSTLANVVLAGGSSTSTTGRGASTSGSTIRADSAMTGLIFRTTTNGVSVSLAVADYVSDWLFFGARDGPAPAAALFLAAYCWTSTVETHTAGHIAAIKRQQFVYKVQSQMKNKNKRSTKLYLGKSPN